MKNAPIRHRLEYGLYWAAKQLLLGLSHRQVRTFGAGLGRLAHRLLARHRRIALDNLAMALPELDADERQATVLRCFEHFGSAFCEAVSFSRFDRETALSHFDIDGWEHLEAARAKGRGLLVTCGHFGSWQVAVYPLGILLGGFHMVARPPDNPLLADDATRMRERFGNVEIRRRGASHRIYHAILKQAVVGMVVDQRVPPDSGIIVPFLGHPARTSSVPALISIRSGAPAVPLTCVPIESGRYRIRVQPAVEPEGKGPEAVSALTTRYLEIIAADLRQHPHLWLWMHRRWRL